eukprot:gnl/TRDRNA2_/TRDRNA2_174638_c1_seq4.p1 gnl/TRDRNA2_/TRDRNA2_174638_c1~~gnl/TRDRNA2_/TRDRNA2_174638_c1_seq4.p1  ORF type:complete len:240 (+),score=55.55 gnl/TRDRNA2_/TRDRNA2_174638_c1_seq4:81-800(+)
MEPHLREEYGYPVLPSVPSRTSSRTVSKEQEANKKRCKVYFHVAYSEVQFGESVHVVGNHPELGIWDPEKSVALSTHEGIFPCWVSEAPIFVDLHEVVEYKYIVCGKDGKLKAWEEYSGNRVFTASGIELTIEDDDGLYREILGVHGGDEDDDDEDFQERKPPLPIKPVPIAQVSTVSTQMDPPFKDILNTWTQPAIDQTNLNMHPPSTFSPLTYHNFDNMGNQYAQAIFGGGGSAPGH